MLLQPERLRYRPLGGHIATAVPQNRVARLCEHLGLSAVSQVHPHQALCQGRPIPVGEQDITGSVDSQPDDPLPINAAGLQTALDRVHECIPPVGGMLFRPTRSWITRLIALIGKAQRLALEIEKSRAYASSSRVNTYYQISLHRPSPYFSP